MSGYYDNQKAIIDAIQTRLPILKEQDADINIEAFCRSIFQQKPASMKFIKSTLLFEADRLGAVVSLDGKDLLWRKPRPTPRKAP